MTFGELMRVTRPDTVRRVTVLGYYRKSKRYYSFATVFDRERGDSDIQTELSAEYLFNEVKTIEVGHGTIDVDLIQWLDDPED